MGIFSTTLTLRCLDAMHISPAWKHADTLEAFEYTERAGRKKRRLGRNVSLIVIDLVPWSRGKGGRRDYFFHPLLPFQNMEKKKVIQKKIIVLVCFAFL